ncbi:MAG: hypothetical protein II816_04700 [Elusimicrobia bacterium]|nr:hypothetical protein [Elusimicrobiota bacterium]
MRKILKNIKGLSLSEVLVSISIVMILSVYGLSFFDAAWKYRSENDEYQTVLNNVVSNLESSKYAIANDKITAAEETLGSDRTVSYFMLTSQLTPDPAPYLKQISSTAYVKKDATTDIYSIVLTTFVYPNWERI